MSVYRQQYDRMQRWYDRFAVLDEGREHDVNSDNYVDDIYAFFLNCYHLKDWIKHDDTLPAIVRRAVEDYINTNRSLRLCADICNSLKHLTLTKSRSHESPAFGKKRFELSLGPGQPTTVRLNYEIDTATGPEDVFQLAADCVGAWDKFLATHGL